MVKSIGSESPLYSDRTPLELVATARQPDWTLWVPAVENTLFHVEYSTPSINQYKSPSTTEAVTGSTEPTGYRRVEGGVRTTEGSIFLTVIDFELATPSEFFT